MWLILLAGARSAQDWGGHQEVHPPSPPPAVVDEPPTPEVFAYDIVLPEIDLPMQIEVESAAGQPVTCTIEALVDPYGQLLDAMPLACPDSLRKASVKAVRSWNFHPPTVDNVAVRGSMEARFVYVSHTVVVDTPTPHNEFLVRVSPTATPRWPTPPTAGREGRQQMKALGTDHVRCVLTLSLDERGLPNDIVPESCDEESLDRVQRRLFRYGLETEGSRPGDGTRYRLDIALK